MRCRTRGTGPSSPRGLSAHSSSASCTSSAGSTSTAVPENTYLPPAIDHTDVERGVPTVRVEDVHVRYRSHEDVTKSLRAMFATLGRRRPQQGRNRYVHALKGISF